MALRLAEAGCDLALHCHTSAAAAAQTAAECQRHNVRAEVFAADLGDAAQTAGLVPAVVARLGRLDVLINNASLFEEQTLDTFELADWERTLRVNLTAPMILAHAARAELRSRNGRIVNLIDAAVDRPWSGHLGYSVSKGGLKTLTQALAKAFAPDVNVVGVAPGVAAWPDDYPPETRAKLSAKIPLKRGGEPADIAALVHFLLAEGDYITGAIVPVDGGRHLA